MDDPRDTQGEVSSEASVGPAPVGVKDDASVTQSAKEQTPDTTEGEGKKEKDVVSLPPPPPPSVKINLVCGLPDTQWLSIVSRSNSLSTLVAISSACSSLRSLLWPPPSDMLATLLIDSFDSQPSLALLGVVKSLGSFISITSPVSSKPLSLPSVPDLIQRLVDPPHSADVHFYGDACLRHAVRHLPDDVVRRLLAVGANAGVDDSDTLFDVVKRKRGSILGDLLQAGSPAKIWDRGWGVLGLAAGLKVGEEDPIVGDEGWVIMLLKQYVNIDSISLEQDLFGTDIYQSLMLRAIEKGWKTLASFFLDQIGRIRENPHQSQYADWKRIQLVLEQALVTASTTALALADREEEAVSSPLAPGDEPHHKVEKSEVDAEALKAFCLHIIQRLLDAKAEAPVDPSVQDHAPLRAVASLGSMPLLTRLTSSIETVNPMFTTLPETILIVPEEIQPLDDGEDIAYILQEGPHRARDDEALRVAAGCGDLKTVAHLLALGADPEALECEALVRACAGGYDQVVHLLLLPYCKPVEGKLGKFAPTELVADILSSQDTAPFRHAASTSNTDLLRLLHRLGSDVHAMEDDALSRAASSNRLANVEMLLGEGADPLARNRRCLRDARRLGHLEIVNALEEAIARVVAGGKKKKGRGGGRLSGFWGHARVVAVDGVDVGAAGAGAGGPA
ncbi:hypothetical protein HDU97_006740 [Phlyctochytrium planicorne]|nr:hypothetical protein HDU97_006740 [Phlyctochytrium planicorne]